MKCTSAVLIVILIMFARGLARSTPDPQTTHPFAIQISAPATVKAGDMLWIKVTLTNTSAHEINVAIVRSGGIDVSYSYDVREAEGIPLERTKSHYGKHIQSELLRTLKPKETASENVNLSRLYNLTAPGKYDIQVSRETSDDPTEPVVRSNKITVTVVP